MKRVSIIFLQTVIILIGIGTIALLLWEPQIEGRNVNATFFEIYFRDPFLALVYIGSISFFIALYQAIKLLGYSGQSKILLQPMMNALRTIKYCALIIIVFVVVEEIFIILGNSDDKAGGIFMGILITFGSIVVVTISDVFEKILQNAVDDKFE